jgi:hypothetical protein
MKFFDINHNRSLVVGTVEGALQFRQTNVYPAIRKATAIYLMFCIFYVMFSDFHGSEPALSIIHVGSAISLIVFWKSIYWGEGRYDTFGAALLLLYAFLKLHAALDTLFYGNRFDEIYHTVPLPENLVWLFLKSETLNHIGILMLVAVWLRTVGNKLPQFSFLNNHHQVGRHLPIVIYVSAIVIELARRVAGEEFGVLTQMTFLTYQFGVVAIFFIASAQGGRYRHIMLALLLAVPMVILAFGTGMKSEMLFPLVPAVLIAWFRFDSISLKVAAVVMGFILLAYAQMYVQYVREVSWADRGTSGQSSSTSAELVDGFQTAFKTLTLREGLNAISSRINMTTSRGITVAIADARGYEPYNIFAPVLSSLIPRFLWSGKPVLQPGAEHTLRIHNLNWSASEAWSATAAGFFSELYLGGGWFGWLFGVVLYATLLGRLQLFTLRMVPGFGHLALSFLTVYWALRFEEKHIVYAYTSMIFTFVFIALIAKSAAMLQGRRRRLWISR